MASRPSHRYAFDDVVVDAENYRVYKAGELRPIGPRAFDLLLDLLRHPGRVLDKDELIDRVWQGVAVTDNALTRAIKDLRRAIGDRARSPKYIETASRRGYRFVADVREVPATRRVSLLVLPFDDLSAAPAAHLTGGLVEELIARLGRLAPDQLTVIGHSSAVAAHEAGRPWAALGRELDADYVVLGSVRRDARVQVSVQLCRVSDAQVAATRTFGADATDAAGVEETLAEAIATDVQVRLSESATPAVPPVPPEAHNALLEGRYFLRLRTADGIAKARAAFERAVAVAPDLARAHVGLAHCHAFFIMGSLPSAEGRADGFAAITRARQLDDRLAEAHAVLAVLECSEWRFRDAERSLRWSIALDPNDPHPRHWLAMFPLVASERYEEALEQLRLARRLDPLSLIISADIAGVYCMTRQFERAVTQCTASLHLDPNFARAHVYLGWARAGLGRHDAAVVALETAARLDASAWTRAWLGYAYGAAGRAADAHSVLETLHRPHAGHGELPFLVGVVHAGLGDVDEALEWFERAVDERSYWVSSLAAFPALDRLRADRRFETLLRRIRDAAWPDPGGTL